SPDASTMQLNQMPRDGEAKPGARRSARLWQRSVLHFTCTGAIHLEEALEDAGEIVFIDANTSICDVNRQHAPRRTIFLRGLLSDDGLASLDAIHYLRRDCDTATR